MICKIHEMGMLPATEVILAKFEVYIQKYMCVWGVERLVVAWYKC